MFINEAFSIRKSGSATSIRSQMWDSSDPQRNPAPLPLPDRDQPVSSVATQHKVSAAHRRLQSSSSSKTLAQETDAADRERERDRVSSRSLYDLLQLVHANLETLMKRSQNNARDLGKLRGDVQNPQVVEDIKRLMQEAATTNNTDPAQQTRMEVDLSHKLEALLRTEKTDKPAEGKWTEEMRQMQTVLQEVQGSMHQLLQQSTAPPLVQRDVALAQDVQALVQWSASVPTQASLADMTEANRTNASQTQHALEQLCVQQAEAYANVKSLLASVSAQQQVNLLSLQDNLDRMNHTLAERTTQLAQVDADLQTKHMALKDLERRTELIQNSLLGMRQEVQTLREEAAASIKKKGRRSPPAVAPALQPVTNRRIVSLTNMAQPSPFARPFDKVMVPLRKSSWSKRVGNLFAANNKENAPAAGLGHVHEGTSEDARSVRSVSYRG